MIVRAKVYCNFKRDGEVSFIPVFSGSEENDRYFKATPFGRIDLGIVNEQAAAQFEKGKEYYVDFSPCTG